MIKCLLILWKPKNMENPYYVARRENQLRITQYHHTVGDSSTENYFQYFRQTGWNLIFWVVATRCFLILLFGVFIFYAFSFLSMAQLALLQMDQEMTVQQVMKTYNNRIKKKASRLIATILQSFMNNFKIKSCTRLNQKPPLIIKK